MAQIVTRPPFVYTNQGILVGDRADARIDLLNGYADNAYNITTNYISTISDLAKALEVPAIDAISIPSVDITDIDYSGRPNLGAALIPTDWPQKDFLPLSLINIPELTPVDFPILNIPDPDFLHIDSPLLDTINTPGDIPNLQDIDIPTAPSLVLPNVPSFDDIIIPSAPDISIPVFDEDAPILEEIDTPAYFQWGEPSYTSDIWSSLLLKIIYNIENGGTGLEASVEADIYNRHINRVLDDRAKAQYEIENYFAARGFELPPGALAGALAELAHQNMRLDAEVSRDITISQAELAQKNTHYVWEMGAKLEGILRDFFNHQANRSLTAATTLAANAIAVYNAKAEAVRIKLDIYKTKASVYETRVRATLASVEVFKAQLEGAKIHADIQKLMVDIYQAQIGAAETLMRLYIAEMQGAKLKSDIELSKLERYKLETQAYVARLDGERMKINLYEAQLRGEGTKAEVYGKQVQAYGYEVDAKAKLLNGRIAELDSKIKQNQLEIDRYKAEIGAWETETRAKASEIGAHVAGFQAETAAYTAETHAQESFYRTKLGELQLRISEASFNMQKAIAEVEAATKGYEAIKTLQIKANEGIMNVGAQLTASALNAINANISISSSSAHSKSISGSYSESLSEAHSFNYE